MQAFLSWVPNTILVSNCIGETVNIVVDGYKILFSVYRHKFFRVNNSDSILHDIKKLRWDSVDLIFWSMFIFIATTL